MKKLDTLVATIVLVFMFLTPVFASDADDLQKLQPLNSLEQSMYKEIKDDVTELHKFIVTRTYIRTLKQLFKTDDIFRQGLGVDAYPIVPDDYDIKYCDSVEQGLDLYTLEITQVSLGKRKPRKK